MTMNESSLRNDVTRVADQPQAANGLAIVRLTIGAMFVWVFFENLGKGLYTPAGYAGLINYYIKASHSPAAWKWVMELMASHAAMAGFVSGQCRPRGRHAPKQSEKKQHGSPHPGHRRTELSRRRTEVPSPSDPENARAVSPFCAPFSLVLP
jgi:hypothetical protein